MGIVASLKEKKLKTGDGRWAIVTLEDTFGQAEVLCFSRVYEAAEALLKDGAPVLVKGRALIDDVDDEEGKQMTPKMRAESVELLSDAQIARTRFLDVVLEVPRAAGAPVAPERFDPGTAADADRADEGTLVLLEKVARACEQYPGAVPARLHLEMPAGYRVTVQSGDGKRVLPSDQLIAALEGIKGITGVVRT